MVHVQGLVSPQGTGLEVHVNMGLAFLYRLALAPSNMLVRGLDEDIGVEFSNLKPIKAEENGKYNE